MTATTDRARFIVELDTTQAEAVLARLRGGGGGGPGPPSVPGGTRPPTPGSPGTAPAAPSQGGGLGGFVDLAALLVSLKESIREIGNAVTAFTDAANRSALRATGLSEGGLLNVRSAQAAAAATADQLGMGGAFASDEQIRRLFDANRRLAELRERGRIRVESVSDPIIMGESAPFFTAMTAALAARRLGLKLPAMLVNR